MGELTNDIQFLPGVGPKRAALIKRELDIHTLEGLIHFYPFRYMDRSSITPIVSVTPDLAYVQVQGQVVSRNLVNIKHLSVIVEDGTGRMEMVFFKGVKWNFDRLAPGSVWLFFGKPQAYNGRINMVHPEVDAPQNDPAAKGTLTGVYPSTEKLKAGGVTGKTMCKLQRAALALCLPEVQESLPDYILKKYGLPSLQWALYNIHFPSDSGALAAATRRLKFEELFYLQLSLLKQKYVRSKAANGLVMKHVGAPFHACYNALPYALTGAQQRVIKEIRADMSGGSQMNRLLQGDVGSGKTMVAVLSCLIAIGNGYQACIMAPTEVLAQQHFANIQKYLAPTGVKCALLTGSTTKKERRPLLEGLADGSVQLVVGTHALIEDPVRYRALGLAVIDEQHRFGVSQRAALWHKGPARSLDQRNGAWAPVSASEHPAIPLEGVQGVGTIEDKNVPPHILVMTATPIPRTLAMTFYGDLDLSVIDEMPPGRKPVQTMLIGQNRLPAMYRFMREEIAKGRQVFVVYPMIFINEKMEDVSNVEQGYEDIVKAFPLEEGYKVAIVHGQQSNEQKLFNMKAFVEGRAHILVSTTVIEVGVDVPNASVMVIRSAQRFGLSQLHQLRGRVGRGAEKSYCILVKDPKTGKDAQERLELMCATEDGFEIAEKDMKMRGPGDLEGTQQSGMPIELHIASLLRDGAMLDEARSCAQKVLDSDPGLDKPQNAVLLRELRKGKYDIRDFSNIS